MKSLNRIIEGLTVVALGLILLGASLGYLPWSVGTTIFALLSLWPVLLISLGLDIIGRSLDAQWLRLLSSLVVLAAVLFGGLVLPASDVSPNWFPFYGSEQTATQESQEFSFEKARDSVTRAAITITGGAGTINVSDGARDVLVSMSGTSPFENPSLSVQKTSGSSADVVASMGEGPTFWPFTGSSEMNVKLSPATRWDVTLETGAATMDADLEALPVSSFMLRTGASDSTVILGKVPSGLAEVGVTVKAGAASVLLKLPVGVPVRVESHSGLASIDVPEGFTRVDSSNGRVYESPDWDSGEGRYSVLIEAGVGTINVEQY